MKSLLKSVAQDVLGSQNQFSTQRTPPEAVEKLLRSLRPRVSQTPLVRFGPRADGGYLIPDDVAGVVACFSPGVSDVSGFELDCAQRGMDVFMADKSVARPAAEHDRFHFVPKFIGATSNDDYVTLDDWVSESMGSRDGDLILQIDIEGAEYESLLAAPDALMRRFRLVVGEFHQLDQLWNAPFFMLVSRVFEKLLQTHVPVHAHPNNWEGHIDKWGLQIPRVLEMTFVRSDRPVSGEYVKDFPHVLDVENNPDAAPIPLPASWRSA
jgi:hypothetical protein